jgi:hypothetical protein
MINPLPPKRFYTMDEDGDIFEATDPEAWREWMEMTDRGVKRTLLPEGCTISTAFTGRNAEWDPNKPPLLFETMVFDGPMNEYRELYQTRNMAERVSRPGCPTSQDEDRGHRGGRQNL